MNRVTDSVAPDSRLATATVSRSPPTARPRVFVAFAGGGAKGLAHVGALKALETHQVDFQGFAGTSAGAIVAALAAAGVRADEMIDPESEASIVAEIATHVPTIKVLTDLFGPVGWPKIRAFRDMMASSTRRRLPPAVLWALVLSIVALALGFTAFSGLIGQTTGAIVALMLWTIVLTVSALGVMAVYGGLARLDTLRLALDKVLTHRVLGPNARRSVLMSDFDGTTWPLLKIVAADISHRKMQLFSRDILPDTPVADAVAASICLPFIFAPWSLGLSRLVDGGIVSNFPAWPFDEERSLDGDALTCGFQIADPPPQGGAQTPSPPAPAPWPFAVIQTALFGSVQLSTRAVGRAEFITLRPELDLLDFDIKSLTTRQVLAKMTAYALTEIDRRLFADPEVYRAACEVTQRSLAEVLQEAGARFLKAPDTPWRVRCAVALPPEGLKRSLQTRHGFGYEDDPDQGLVWPLDATSLAGQAWTGGTVIFEHEPLARDLELTGSRNAALRRLVWRELAWSFRVPIYNSKGEPALVVLLDGSAPLRQSQPVTKAFEAFADVVDQTFKPVVAQFEDHSAHG